MKPKLRFALGIAFFLSIWLIIGLPQGSWALLPPAQENFLIARGGVRIHCVGFERKEGSPTLAILHGYGQSSKDFLPLSDSLYARGFSVYLMDLRGHGRSGGERFTCERFEDYREDLKAFLSWVKPRIGEAPLFLYGHSLGGIVVLSYGFKYPEDVSGLIVSGPALGFYASLPPVGKIALPCWVLRLLQPGLSLLAGWFPQAPIPFTGLRPTVKASLAREVNRAILSLYRGGYGLKRPCLILQGSRDRLVPPKAVERFFYGLVSPTKTLILYANLGHNLYRGKSESPILGDMLRWIALQGKRMPPPGPMRTGSQRFNASE